MKFRVILMPAADRELVRTLAWLHERSPEGAEAWFDRWLEVLETLESTPSLLGVAPEDAA